MSWTAVPIAEAGIQIWPPWQGYRYPPSSPGGLQSGPYEFLMMKLQTPLTISRPTMIAASYQDYAQKKPAVLLR